MPSIKDTAAAFCPGGRTMLAGVMGWPVAHSLSPRVHTYWLRHYGLDGVYVALAVEPSRLEVALRSLPALGFRGVNLTLPHKQAALGILDHITPLAARVGAVNTVTVHPDGSLEGDNTDVTGCVDSLKQAGCRIDTGPATVLGSGGAARAVVAGLLNEGCPEIRLVNRSIDRAEALAHDFGPSVRASAWGLVDKALERAHLLINTTSLGMQGQPPLEVDLSALSDTATVMDIVYAPLETDLLRRARDRGVRAVDGLGMLLHQARPGFERWFGSKPAVTDELRHFVLERP